MSPDLQASLWMFFGRLHPLVLHLPIGLWFGVVVLEFGGAIFRRKPKTADGNVLDAAPAAPPVAPGAITSLAWIAALSGALAASTGWMLGEEGANSGSNFELHRWFGVSAGTLGLLAAAASGFRARRAFRSLLVALLLVLMPAGHLGGGMTHGEDFLTEPFAPKSAPAAKPSGTAKPSAGSTSPAPATTQTAPQAPVQAQSTAATTSQGSAPAQGSVAEPTITVLPSAVLPSAVLPSAVPPPAVPPPLVPPSAVPPPAVGAGVTFAAIQPILKRLCISCHNSEKHKGDLRLHDRAGIEQGGANGAVLVRGKPDESKLLTNLLLPIDDDAHMPPKGKPQPTDEEIATLRAWIAAGAPLDDAAAPTNRSDNPSSTEATTPQKAAASDAKANTEPVKATKVETQAVPTSEVKTTGGTSAANSNATPAPAASQVAAAAKPSAPGSASPEAIEPVKAAPAAVVPPKAADLPIPQSPTQQEPARQGPAKAEPAKAKPEQPSANAPVTATATATVTIVAAKPAPKPEAPKSAINRSAIDALRMRQIDVREAPPGGVGLTIDFAAVATTMTEGETKSLLQPLVEHITDLGLARVPVGDELCTLCSRMPALGRLDLRLTQVTSQGVKSLAGLTQLKELILAQTRLDDSAVDAILALPALTKVYVWNSGLPNEAIARLRQRQGLTVDAGDTPPAKALEVEGELKFVNELPLPGQKPPPPEVAAALMPVNAICPVSGKPVDPQFVVVHGQQAVGFCCMNCPKTFWAEPTKFPVQAKQKPK